MSVSAVFLLTGCAGGSGLATDSINPLSAGFWAAKPASVPAGRITSRTKTRKVVRPASAEARPLPRKPSPRKRPLRIDREQASVACFRSTYKKHGHGPIMDRMYRACLKRSGVLQ